MAAMNFLSKRVLDLGGDSTTSSTQNGTTKTVGTEDFQVNNFFTEFSAQVVDEAGNPVAITAQAKALPQMNGSGMVRNIQAAASLSADFAGALATYIRRFCCQESNYRLARKSFHFVHHRMAHTAGMDFIHHPIVTRPKKMIFF